MVYVSTGGPNVECIPALVHIANEDILAASRCLFPVSFQDAHVVSQSCQRQGLHIGTPAMSTLDEFAHWLARAPRRERKLEIIVGQRLGHSNDIHTWAVLRNP